MCVQPVECGVCETAAPHGRPGAVVVDPLRAQRELASIDISDVAAEGDAEVSGFAFTTPNTTSVMVSVKTRAECARESVNTHGMVVVNGGQITELGSIGTPRLF